MRDVKTALISTHRWLGLTLGLLAIWLAVSGAWLVFRPQLDPLASRYLNMPQACNAPLPLDRVVALAQAAYPESKAESVWLKADATATTTVRFKDMNQAYVDGCSGRVLALNHRYAGVFGFAEYLHRFRFLPTTEIAEWVGGIGAAVLAFGLALVGLYAWFPRRRGAVKPSIKLNFALSGRARARNQHTVIGAFAALVILVVAGTGVPQAFKPVEHLLYTLSGSSESAKVKAPDVGRGPAAVETAWRGALAKLGAMPNTATIRLGGNGKPIEMYVNEIGAPHAEARTYFYNDPADGRLLKFIPYAATPAGERIYMWLLALHMGMVGGLFGQLLTLFGVLAVPYLGYTGLRSWWLRRTKRQPQVVFDGLTMRIGAVTSDTEGVRSIRLVPERGTTLAPFEAGGHIEVTAGGIARPYSLVNGPDHNEAYEVGVRLIADGRGGSMAMHRLQVGDKVQVSRPRCHFALDAEAEFSILVAAGIGITPILSMARHLRADGKDYRLLYFGRHAGGMAYLPEVVSECGDAASIHTGLPREGIREELSAALAIAPVGTHLYVCGPAGFMDMVFAEGRAAGLAEDALHREYFEADPSLLAGPRAAFQLTLARSNRIIAVDEQTSVLDALSAHGVVVPSACEQGICGNCRTVVLDGDIDHRDSFLSSAERQRGDCMMICVSRARGGSLVLDA